MRSITQLLRVVGFGCFICTLSGCNQADPVNDSDTRDGIHPPWVWQCESPGNNEDAKAGDYYPTVDNAKWSFHRHGGLELLSNDTLVADFDSWENLTMSQTTLEGETAFCIEDSPNANGKVTRNWHVRIGDVVFRKHKEEFKEDDPDTTNLSIDYFLGTQTSNVEGVDRYVDGFTRYDSAWIDGEVNASETLAYNRIVIADAGGGGGDLGVEEVRVHTFTVKSVDETVEVPAGTFTDCLRIRRERQREPDSNATENERRGDKKEYWYCPGIGKVKEQEINDDPRIEELLYYCVPNGLCCESEVE